MEVLEDEKKLLRGQKPESIYQDIISIYVVVDNDLLKNYSFCWCKKDGHDFNTLFKTHHSHIFSAYSNLFFFIGFIAA